MAAIFKSIRLHLPCRAWVPDKPQVYTAGRFWLNKGVVENGVEELWFNFQKTKYVYDRDEKKKCVPLVFPISQSISTYLDRKGLQYDHDIKHTENLYGKNLLEMDILRIMELFQERATAPFFVFQVFCVGLWCLDEYWYYSVFTLFMLVAFDYNGEICTIKNYL